MRGMLLTVFLVTLLQFSTRAAADSLPDGATFFVSPDGNDAWSGKLASQNATGTDGPFESIARARDAVKELKAHAMPQGEITICVRGGTYFLSEPLSFGPDDSGSATSPVVYAAYPDEMPVISGGRPIGPWRRDGKLFVADVPDIASGKWNFRQLFVGDERQIRARTPNFDPQKPYTGGWHFITKPLTPEGQQGAFGESLVRIHTPGDTFTWAIDVPATGEYQLWFYYGALNAPHGRTNMAGRTTMQVDDSNPVVLDNLPDTGGWRMQRWSCTATLSLTAGRHRLRWTNVQGGGLDFDAFALCNDPQWKPKDRELTGPAPDKHVILVQAEAFDEATAREFGVNRQSTPAYKDRFHFRPGDWQPWPRSPNPEVHIFPAWGWVNAILSVHEVDFDNQLVHVTNSNCSQELRLGNRYYVDNVFEALDSPGEWYFDRAASKLYYWPRDPDFSKKGAFAPALDRLIDLRGDIDSEEGQQNRGGDTSPTDGNRGRCVEHVVFRGFTFKHTTYSLEIPSVYSPDDSAIWMQRARHCSIENCRFLGVGGYAVRMSLGSSDNRVTGNRVADAGQGGVLLVGELTETQPRNNLIAGNTIANCGKIWKHVAGIYVTTGSGNRIAHNTITDMPRYGVSLKSYSKGNVSHNNIVEWNRIERTNLETNDTGAIETLGRDGQDSGNIIRYNMILDVIGLKTSETGEVLTPYYTWGIYLDDYSSGTHVFGNIVARTFRGSGHIHLGRNNVFENNIFVDGYERQFECNGRDDMINNKFLHNIVVWRHGSLMRIRGGQGKCLSQCDNNFYWMVGQDLDNPQGLVEPLSPHGTWAQWRDAGFDRESIVGDPGFVALEDDDFRLKGDSPAVELGFQPIDVARIGAIGFEPE